MYKLILQGKIKYSQTVFIYVIRRFYKVSRRAFENELKITYGHAISCFHKLCQNFYKYVGQ
jgi:hypothetical protein